MYRHVGRRFVVPLVLSMNNEKAVTSVRNNCDIVVVNEVVIPLVGIQNCSPELQKVIARRGAETSPRHQSGGF